MWKVLVFLAVVGVCTLSVGAHPSDSKIVGGSSADIKDFPYQLSLRKSGRHSCGASIISKNWALTASHCVEGFKPQNITLVAGSTFRTTGGSIHKADKIVMHPKYDTKTMDYDFALIRVDTRFALNTTGVRAVKLAEKKPIVGTNGTITGWGTTRPGANNLPDHLQKVNIPILNLDVCKKNYIGYNITERMLCAGVMAGGKDSCQGDSGGPLVVNGVQVGIVSWGYGCAVPEKPGIYADVASMISWIKNEAGL